MCISHVICVLFSESVLFPRFLSLFDAYILLSMRVGDNIWIIAPIFTILSIFSLRGNKIGPDAGVAIAEVLKINTSISTIE